MERRRVAVFVDFDNVYSGLEDQDPEAAERFATDPERWVSWLARRGTGAADPVDRAILMKRCYLNPAAFGRFRRNFVGSGFEVVDCPPLTAQGKTSADIRIVMDMLDTLQHATRFDEFILLASDADYTPILVRLRAHDRRTTVVAVGFTSAAYRASCDELITGDEISREALGLDGDGPGAAGAFPGTVEEALLEAIRQMIAVAPGPIPSATVAGALYDRVLRPRGLSWEAFGGFKEFSLRFEPHGYALAWEAGPGWVYDPARHPRPVAGPAPARQPIPVTLPEAVTNFIESQVLASPNPLSSAVVAGGVHDRLLVPLGLEWDDLGGFKGFVEGLSLSGVEISWAVPGWFYDPARHERPAGAVRPTLDHPDPALVRLADDLHRFKGVPLLTPEAWADVFRWACDYVATHGFYMTAVSKALRDEYEGKLPRDASNFILKGIKLGGYELRYGDSDPWQAATAFRDNVRNLAADLYLNQDEMALIDGWILGGFEPEGEGRQREAEDSTQTAGLFEDAVALEE